MNRPFVLRGLVLAAASILLLFAAGTAAAAGGYTVTALVSDQPGVAPTTDPHLVNPWGITASASSPWWVANNHTDSSTLYNGAGQIFPPPPSAPIVVTVTGGPTGMVFNGGTQFLVLNGAGTAMAPARFLWATEAGNIQGWNSGSVARLGADRSAVGANYKGLAIAGNTLYAADFHNGRVDMFDGSFHLSTPPGAFTDPKLPSGYSPFGIQNVGGHIFVAYAKLNPATGDEVAGRGLGTVDEYDANGALVGRVANHGKLNAPWGIAAVGASGFGTLLPGDLIVGNFGDGRLNAFRRDASGWSHVDQIRDGDGLAIEIEGLWGIAFGNGATAGPPTSLYFAAGTDDETHGLFGAIKAAAPPV